MCQFSCLSNGSHVKICLKTASSSFQKAKGQRGSCTRRVTRGAALQAWSIRCDERGVARLAGLTNTHLEGAAHHVAPIELHVDGVDAIFVGDKPNGIFVCREKRPFQHGEMTSAGAKLNIS